MSGHAQRNFRSSCPSAGSSRRGNDPLHSLPLLLSALALPPSSVAAQKAMPVEDGASVSRLQDLLDIKQTRPQYTVSPRDGRSRNEVSPRRGVFINGVAGVREDDLQAAQSLADFHGYRVELIENTSDGLAVDLRHCLDGKILPEALGRVEPSVYQLTAQLLDLSQASQPEKLALHVHSQGSLIAQSALALTSSILQRSSDSSAWQTLLDRIDVYTYGAAAHDFPLPSTGFAFENDLVVSGTRAFDMVLPPSDRLALLPTVQVHLPLARETLGEVVNPIHGHYFSDYLDHQAAFQARALLDQFGTNPEALALGFENLAQSGSLTQRSLDRVLSEVLNQADVQNHPGESTTSQDVWQTLRGRSAEGRIGDYQLPRDPHKVELPSYSVPREVDGASPQALSEQERQATPEAEPPSLQVVHEQLRRFQELSQKEEQLEQILQGVSLVERRGAALQQELDQTRAQRVEIERLLAKDAKAGLEAAGRDFMMASEMNWNTAGYRGQIALQGHGELAKQLEQTRSPEEAERVMKAYTGNLAEAQQFVRTVEAYQAWGQVAAQVVGMKNPKAGRVLSSAVNLGVSLALASTGNPVAIAGCVSSALGLIGAFGSDENQQAKLFEQLFDVLNDISNQIVDLHNDLREFRAEVHRRFDAVEDRLAAILDYSAKLLRGQRRVMAIGRQNAFATERVLKNIRAFRERYEDDQQADRSREEYALTREYQIARDQQVPFFGTPEQKEAREQERVNAYLGHAYQTAREPLLTGSDRQLFETDELLSALQGRSVDELYGLLERGTEELLHISAEERLSALFPGMTEEQRASLLREVGDLRLAALNPKVFVEGVEAFLESPAFSDEWDQGDLRQALQALIQLGELHQRQAQFLGSPSVQQAVFNKSDEELSNFIRSVAAVASSEELNIALQEQGGVDLSQGIEQFYRSRESEALAVERPFDRQHHLHSQRIPVAKRPSEDILVDIDKRIFGDFNFETRVIAGLQGGQNSRAAALGGSVELSNVVDPRKDYTNKQNTVRERTGIAKARYSKEVGPRDHRSKVDVVLEQPYRIDVCRYREQTSTIFKVEYKLGNSSLVSIETEGERQSYHFYITEEHHCPTHIIQHGYVYRSVDGGGGYRKTGPLSVRDLIEYSSNVEKQWDGRMKQPSELLAYMVQDTLREHAPGRNLRSVHVGFKRVSLDEARQIDPDFEGDDAACIIQDIDLAFEYSDEQALEQGRRTAEDPTTAELQKLLKGKVLPGVLCRFVMKWEPQTATQSDEGSVLEPFVEYLAQRSTKAPAHLQTMLRQPGSALAEAAEACEESTFLLQLYSGLGVPRKALEDWAVERVRSGEAGILELGTQQHLFLELPQAKVAALLAEVVAEGRPVVSFLDALRSYQEERRASFAKFQAAWQAAYPELSQAAFGAESVADVVETMQKKLGELSR
ncbi:hypothetical protein MRY87_07210 [bacterium]|nr:hypothetical protein [bacterium]